MFGDDVARFEVGFEQGANSVTGVDTFGVFVGVFGGCAGGIGQGEAHAFDGAGHGIGGVHAAASTSTRTGVFDDFLAFGIAERVCEKFAVALKGRDDIEFAFFTLNGGATGLYCAAVDHQGRAIEAAHCHDHAGHVFVAAGQCDQSIVPLRAHEGFDGVGDEVAGLQGEGHAVCAHGYAVGYADGVEAHANAPGFGDAFFGFGGEVVEVHVARVAFVPDRGNADLCFVHVGACQSRGIEHGLGSALGFFLGDLRAVLVQFCH